MARSKPKGVIEQRRAFIVGANFIEKAVSEHCDLEVIAIDPAIGCTGWAYRRKNGKMELGRIAPPTYGFSRYIYIEKKLKKIIGDRFPLAIIEGYAHNAKWGREVAGELGGIIRRVLYFRKRPLLRVSPLTIKSWIRAKKKEHIMLEILDKYKVKIPDQDIADAFLLCDIGYRAIHLAKDVVERGLDTPEEVRIYLKNQGYKDSKPKELGKLFKYQETSLFNLFVSQGPVVEFFSKAEPTLDEF